jgi:hypothetical protein
MSRHRRRRPERYDPLLTAVTQRDGQVGTGIKVFVVLFLAAFVVCGVGNREVWPFTGWRLFSQVRTGSQASWQATVLDADRTETLIDFGALPRSFHGSLAVLRGFPRLSPAERLGVCAAWAGALRARGLDVSEIRVYRTVTTIPLGRDRATTRTGRTLRYTCDP